MGAPTQRDLQAQERRHQLLDTALRLFAENGVENTSIKDIAAEAGVAQGLIYHYFRSKDDLLWAIIGQVDVLSELSAVLAPAADRPAREVLVAAATHALRLLSERPELQATARVVLREALIRPQMRQTLRAFQAVGLGLLTRYLDARIAAGELRPHNPDVTARMLVGSVVAVYITGAPAEAHIPEVVDTLLRGLAAR